MTDPIQEPIEDKEDIKEEPIPLEEAKKSRKVRTAKQIEALDNARIKCFAKRREKSELKAKQKQDEELKASPANVQEPELEKSNDELEPSPANKQQEPQEEPINIIERHEQRKELKKTLTLTQDELHEMMERVAVQSKPIEPPKSKFKMIDGMFVLR
jgi:hypothetical protein